MDLSVSIEKIKGVGEKTAKLYHKLGIYTAFDLINHIPRRYEDYSTVQNISNLRPGNVTIKAKLSSVNSRYGRNGLHVTQAIASDETGSLAVVWFNQPYRSNSIKPGEGYYISGKFDFSGNRLSLQNPSIELEDSLPVNSGRILAVYPETKGLSSKVIRKHISTVLASDSVIQETLPASVVEDNKLISKADAYKYIHRPDSVADIEDSRYRLGFEEIFELSLASLSARNEIENTLAPKINADIDLTNQLLSKLSFKLTNAQRKVAWQIYQDISDSRPMNRLVEGDVGSGKTLVAALAALITLADGYQAVFLAPTEILAKQHAETFYELFNLVGLSDRVMLITGSMSKKQKTIAKQDVASSDKPKLIIGTHALLQADVEYQQIGLIVTDEQHRFGVNQRRHLISKANHTPHMLSMTATPIPRSLALTVFGELDISIIDEKPKGRKPTQTTLVKPNDRERLYKQLRNELKQSSGQAYVVCPVISQSEFLPMKSVERVSKEIQTLMSGLRVESLHGKMKAEEKDKVMADFVAGKIDVLVSTTVIEVGVNVPNANTMVIESADRFGLAQLHQLRGRIGRATEQGSCYLLTDSEPTRRLRAIESTNDGFKLAELDLELRGAGAIYGTRQHGELDLRIANFTDAKLFAAATNASKQFVKDPDNLVQYPYIKERIRQLQSVVHLN